MIDISKGALLATFLLSSVVGTQHTYAAEKINLRQLPVTAEIARSLNARGMAAVAPEVMGDAIAREFRLPASNAFEFMRESQTPSGMSHLYLNQTYRDIPIWGERVVVSRNSANQIVRLNGNLIQQIASDVQDVTPAFSPQEALQRAKDSVRRKRGLVASTIQFSNESSKLVIFVRPADNQARLSYEVTFLAVLDPQTGEATRPVFLMDAKTGETLYHYENLQSADGKGPGGNKKTGKYFYGLPGPFSPFEVEVSGETCRMNTSNVTTEDLNHGTAGTGSAFSFPCSDNTVREINGAYSPLNDAHHFGAVVFQMYKEWYETAPLTHKLLLQVHYGNEHENAYWNGTAMQFGDGKNIFYPLVSLDVVSHEVSHGYTEQNSQLIYAGQSGGINEAFSDMAGEAADSFGNGGQTPDFETGSAIFKQEGRALRYLCQPSRDGRSIESAKSYFEGLDVHYSSGVFNKAFCLLAKTSGWTVRTAFHAFLVANRDYWTPSTNFAQGAQGVVDAASDLGYSTQDVINAFAAVDVLVPTAALTFLVPETSPDAGLPSMITPGTADPTVAIRSPATLPPSSIQPGSAAEGQLVARASFPQTAAPDSPPDEVFTLLGDRYIHNTLRVITSSAPRGCSIADWNCMKNICKADLGPTAWRGWAGCDPNANNEFICYFECSQMRRVF